MTEPLMTPEQMARESVGALRDEARTLGQMPFKVRDEHVMRIHRALDSITTERTRREEAERALAVMDADQRRWAVMADERIATRDAQLAVMMAALREYGDHDRQCKGYLYPGIGKCSCGFTAALHAQPATPTDAGMDDTVA